MELQIVQTKDESFEGYVLRYIFGLNLLPDEHPRRGSRSDPRLVFLCEIARRQNVAGVIHKYADSAYRLKPFLPEGSYEPVANSIITDELFGPTHLSDSNGLFFPKVEPNFFDFEEMEEDGKYKAVLFHILYCDAIALFVSPMSEDAPSQLSELLRGPITSNEEFLRKAVELYEVTITSHADGDFFGCYADDQSKFEILDSPLDATVSEIKDTRWFQELKDDLVWDGRYSMCLIEKNKVTD